MAINRINETDLQDKLVSQLSNRPTDPRSAGGDNLTAQQVKARHDALGLLVKDKLNELLDALNNATVDGEPVTPLSDLITVVADGVSKSLTEWIEAKLTKSTMAGEGVHAYGVDDDGEQTMLPVSDAATEGSIPQYGTGGVLPVADGTADGHAMNKGQVDALVSALADAIAAKYTKPDGGIPLTDLAASVSAIISDALKWSNADTSATPFKVPIRDGTGVVHGATYGASAVGTALVNKEQFEPVKALAEGASQAAAAENYSALVGILSEAPKTKYKAGQRFLIGTYGVPDVGVLSVEDTAVSYTYTTDAAFEASLMAGTLQIGYFVLRPIEGKTNLEDYSTTAETNAAISAAIDLLVDALVDGVMAVAEAAYAESATYSQQADFANQINTDREIEDADTACPPVVFGTVGGNAEVQSGLMKFPELRGHTIKWNQLADCANTTYDHEANTISSKLFNYHFVHKYLAIFDYEIESSVGNIYFLFGVWNSSQTSYRRQQIVPTSLKGRVAVVVNFNNISATDLTDGAEAKVILQHLGTDITAANRVSTSNIQFFDLTAIYGVGNEPSTVAEFVRDYPKPYYPYNAGTLLSSKSSSVDFIKRNQWDEEWEVGGIDDSTGAKIDVLQQFRSKNYILVLPNTDYFFAAGTTLYTGGYVYFYDANKSFIGRAYTTQYDVRNQVIKTPLNCVYVLFKVQMTSGTGDYKNDICIYINWETPGLPYVSYYKQHITLPNIELRSAGSTYDVLYQQGGGKRRIGIYTFDGTETWEQGGSQTTAGMYRYYTRAITDMKFGLAQGGWCNKFDNLGSNWNSSTTDGVFFGYNNELLQFITATAKTEAELQAIFDSTVTVYYELATETDITVEENPGWDEYAEIDNFGTVKFNQDPAQDIPVPQAYFVRYTVNLVEFLDSLYVHCGGDVSKIALVE